MSNPAIHYSPVFLMNAARDTPSDIEIPDFPEKTLPMDCVDNWSVGYVDDGHYTVMEDCARTRRHGALAVELRAPAYSGQLAMCVSDVLGRSWYYALESGCRND